MAVHLAMSASSCRLAGSRGPCGVRGRLGVSCEVVVEVVVVVFARRSRGAGAGGVQDASVVFAVEVEEVVVEVLFKDAHGHFLA